MGQPVVQWQILAKDPDRCARFYSDLFGWRIDCDNALSYRAVKTEAGRGIEGGIWPSPPEGDSRVQLFVEVDDVGATLAKAVRLGAQVVVPPQVLPDGDEMAIFVDAEGLSTGLFKPA
jgi:predicted enzyme related to lactoylglutathione lyase